MLFKVTPNNFFYDNPEAKSINEFRNLNSDIMKFITLVHDYKSPLRQLPEEERIEVAIEQISFKKTPTGRLSKTEKEIREARNEKINKAVEFYNKIQFDEDKDSLDAYDNLISDIKNLMRKQNKTESELKLAKDSVKAYISLLEDRNRLVEILGVRSESPIIVEEESHDSLVESFLDNKNNNK